MKIIGKIDTRKVNRLLITGRRRAERIDPALNSIKNLVQSSVEQNFEEEGRPKAWKKLSDARIQQRIRIKKWPGPILTVTAQLRSSVNTRVERNSVIVGSNKDYAEVQNADREFLLFQKEDITEAEEILLEHLLRGIR